MRVSSIVTASLLLLLFAASEAIIGIPVARGLDFAVAALFAVGLLRLVAPRKQRGRILAFTVVCLVLAALYLVPWSSRAHFLRRLDSVRPGMSVREVQGIMAGYMEGTGWPANPLAEPNEFSESPGQLTIPDALVFRHSDEPAYNSDWGVVHFRAGRVTKVEFSAD